MRDGDQTWYAKSAFLNPPAILRAAWLIKADGAFLRRHWEGSMLSSFALAVTICFVAGTIIVVALVARARGKDTIARVLYDTEHPKETR
jgi:hypothetical protein